MEIPIWLIALATIWKLALETAQIISTHKLEARKLEQKDEK